MAYYNCHTDKGGVEKMETEGKIVFKKKLINFGNSIGLIPPKDILEYLGAKLGTELYIISEEGKYGKYISIWNPKQQQKK